MGEGQQKKKTTADSDVSEGVELTYLADALKLNMGFGTRTQVTKLTVKQRN